MDSILRIRQKLTNFYRPGAIVVIAENIFTCKINTSDSRVVRYEGEIFYPINLPSNVNILEEDAYLHQ